MNPTFNTLPIGETFRWRSNQGAGDLLKKTGKNTYQNLTVGGESRPLYKSIFVGNDPVKDVGAVK